MNCNDTARHTVCLSDTKHPYQKHAVSNNEPGCSVSGTKQVADSESVSKQLGIHSLFTFIDPNLQFCHLFCVSQPQIEILDPPELAAVALLQSTPTREHKWGTQPVMMFPA